MLKEARGQRDDTTLLSLPMYLFAPTPLRIFTVGLARHIAAQGLLGVQITEPRDVHAHWQEPNLLLSQACGYPLMHELAGKVQLVGTFGYTAEGCSDWHARSAIVLRKSVSLDPIRTLDALRGLRFAYNSAVSQSGYHALARHLQRKVASQSAGTVSNPSAQDFLDAFFGNCIETGGHQASLEHLRDNKADIAAIDCVSWAGLQHTYPDLCAPLRVLAWTYAYPGLPLITNKFNSPEDTKLLRGAIQDALNDPELQAAKDALFIDAFYPTKLEDYRSIA